MPDAVASCRVGSERSRGWCKLSSRTSGWRWLGRASAPPLVVDVWPFLLAEDEVVEDQVVALEMEPPRLRGAAERTGPRSAYDSGCR